MKHIFLIMTDSCNFKCSFCYKKDKILSSGGNKMSPTQARKALDWLMENELWDPDDTKSVVNLWGGEPFVNSELIRFMLEEYPQMYFRINTNGALVKPDMAEFLSRHRYHLTLTLSLGSVHEVYGSMEKALEKLNLLVDLVCRYSGSWGVNFTVSRPEKLYEDYKAMRARGIQNILIDIPRFTEISETYLALFEENYRLVGNEFNIHDKRGTEEGMTYCGSGIDRLVIDYNGDIYPCDGLYGIKKKKLGNISQPVNVEGFLEFEGLKKNVARFYEPCKDCETKCWFERCMAVNIHKNGDMFKPDPNWCKIRRTFKKMREEVVHV